jgi:hypothetical protein
MAKQRGSPDRRGMGAQSDFIAEQFVPSEQYKAQQMAMVEKLIAAGANPEQISDMFAVPFDLLSGGTGEDTMAGSDGVVSAQSDDDNQENKQR